MRPAYELLFQIIVIIVAVREVMVYYYYRGCKPTAVTRLNVHE